MDDLKNLTIEALNSLRDEKVSALRGLDLENPTAEVIAEGEALASALDAIDAELQARQAAAEENAQKAAALRARASSFADEQPKKEGDSTGAVDNSTKGESAPIEAEETKPRLGEPNTLGEPDVIKDTEEAVKEADSKKSNGGTEAASRPTVASLARKVGRPEVPARSNDMVTITAAADVPEFSAGSRIETIDALVTAAANRMSGFAPPSGDGTREDLHKFGVASIRLPFDPDLVIDRGSDDMEVLYRAADETRLPQNSLTAAAGWCAPSETLYDLCGDETVDGLLSIPEVAVRRGGIRYTNGPDFSAIYAHSGYFSQTETQAIAGTTKPCYEIPCPAFQEVRLDVMGLCLKIPILQNVGYPELTNRWMTGSMVAHQMRVNASVITRILALSPATRTITGLGSTVFDTLEQFALVAAQTRQKYRLGSNKTLESFVPLWVKEAFRLDISRRTGVTPGAVGDNVINGYFSALKVNVQYVYGFQELPLVDDPATTGVNELTRFPATFDTVMYPAGTFIKGTADVINLSAVYDSASLSTNVYTGLFFEEGILVAKMCYDPVRLTLPVCNAGRTGAANFTCP